MQRLTEGIFSVRHCWMLDLAPILLLRNIKVLLLLPLNVFMKYFSTHRLCWLFSVPHAIVYMMLQE